MQYKDNQSLAPPWATDPGRAHGTMVNGGRQKIKCKYCHKIFLGGGISRLKQHLAGERGNVAPCEDVPEEVKLQIQQHLGFKVLEKLKKQKEASGGKNSCISCLQDRADGDVAVGSTQNTGIRKGKEVLEGTSNRRKRRKKQDFTKADVAVVSPQTGHNFLLQEKIDAADNAVARFFYDAGILFSVANSHYFQQMADSIAAAGPGYTMPSYDALRGDLLNRNRQDVEEYCAELRRSWELTGCSILVDRWRHSIGDEVVNFFVYCPKGTMFLKSMDVSQCTKSAEVLLSIFDSVIQEVGPKNIVNFVTDSSANFRSAAKLLGEKYKTFFCSTCVTDCIDLILQEIGELDEIREVLTKAKRITRFIYNNPWVLNLMRKRTGGRDIIELARTRFASIFSTLEKIVSFNDHLHQMFTSASWMQSSFSKQRVGIEVAEILVDPLFWSLCDQAVNVAKPLLSILHLIECHDKPSSGFIHDALEKAKKGIMMSFKNKDSDYLPYLKIIDHVWLEEFHSPLYAAAHYLNPSVFYSPTFSSNKVVQKALLDCIETIEPNLSAQVNITSQIKFYEEGAGDFGRPVALRSRESLVPATWWSLYAGDYPDLQRLAIKILSQSCSVVQSKRSLTMFEQIKSKNRNRLEQQGLNDVIFVHYNLDLQDRRMETSKSKGLDPIWLEANMGDWVEDDVAVPCERAFPIRQVHNEDDSNESTTEDSSEVTRGIDGEDVE